MLQVMFPDPKERDAQNLPTQHDNTAHVNLYKRGFQTHPLLTHSQKWGSAACGVVTHRVGQAELHFPAFPSLSVSSQGVPPQERFPADLEVEVQQPFVLARLGRHFHCLRAALLLWGSSWARNCYTFPGILLQLLNSWARGVFSCVTKATSELPLQVIHFLRLGAVRTGRGSSPSSWAPAHPCSPSPHFLSIFPSPLPALWISSSTTRHEDNLPETVPAATLEQGQSPVMNPTCRLDRWTDWQTI